MNVWISWYSHCVITTQCYYNAVNSQWILWVQALDLCPASVAKMMNAISWWRHHMETFSAWVAICAGYSPVKSPQKGQWRGALMFYLICAWINSWVNVSSSGVVVGSTSIPARLDTLVYCELFSWLTSGGTTRNTVIRLGWSRIGLAVLILHAAGVGLTDRPAVISGRYNKYHSLQLQNYYAHFPPLQHTHIHANTTMRNWSWEWSWVLRHCMLAVAGGILCDRVKRLIGH